MSTITRRTAIAAAATAAATPLISTEPAIANPLLPELPQASEIAAEPLLQTIRAFYAGMQEYEIRCVGLEDPDDAEASKIRLEQLYAETFKTPLESLKRWPSPAQTRAGAIAALQLVSDDMQHSIEADLIESMVNAALGYFRAAEAISSREPSIIFETTSEFSDPGKYLLAGQSSIRLKELAAAEPGIMGRVRFICRPE